MQLATGAHNKTRVASNHDEGNWLFTCAKLLSSNWWVGTPPERRQGEWKELHNFNLLLPISNTSPTTGA